MFKKTRISVFDSRKQNESILKQIRKLLSIFKTINSDKREIKTLYLGGQFDLINVRKKSTRTADFIN
ncbi:MAG: hypothetical protein ACE5D0_09755 [Fidelibacterota bacterium]